MSKKQRRIQKKSHEVVDFNHHEKFNQKIELIPRNIRQESYICSLFDNDVSVVFATGPAGTGKTMMAVLAAIKALKEGSVSKLVVTRPAVGVDNEKHGFLPGGLNDKMEPWTRPIFDVLHEHFTTREIARMLEEQIIEISPLAFMRGRTFHRAWIIADEMQNTTKNQMKMLLTRIGEDSKAVITGDLDQTDIVKDNGLLDFIQIIESTKSDLIAHIRFDNSDVQRSETVREVLRLYNNK